MIDETDRETETGAAFVGLLLVVPLIAIDGWVLSVLWGWFAVPIFNLPPLTWLTAVGLAVLLGYIQYRPRKSRSGLEHLRRQGDAAGAAVVYLAIGWLVHLVGG